MSKLMRANLTRLLKNKGFIVSVLLIIVIEAGFTVLLLRNAPLPCDMVLFLSLEFISILASILISLYLGTEYSDGTMRNKLIAGHTRKSVYFSSLLTGIIAVTVLFAAEVVTGIVLGTLLFDAPALSISELILVGAVGWLACVALTSVYTFVGMLSSGKATTAIINVLTSFALIILALVCVRMLSSDILTEAEKRIFYAIYEINPSGQLIQTFTVNVKSPVWLMLYSVILTAVTTVVGLFIFEKKDLK